MYHVSPAGHGLEESKKKVLLSVLPLVGRQPARWWITFCPSLPTLPYSRRKGLEQM